LENTREFDPSFLTANPSLPIPGPSTLSQAGPSQPEIAADIDADPFASYFSSERDPTIPPKVLITTSPRATRVTYKLCEELVGLVPGAEFIRRKKGKDFVVGKIAGWCAGRGYSALMVVNEDTKKPSMCIRLFSVAQFLSVQMPSLLCTFPTDQLLISS
jgi:ribosome production factor 1